MSRLRVGVLVSGTGSLLQAILDGRDELYDVAVVVSDRDGIQGLDRAGRAGVPTVVVDWTAYGKEGRAAFTAAVVDALRRHQVDLVASAGFMRILSASFLEAFPMRALNSHPALLPSFPGAHGVRDALEHGVKVTGTTIHFMTEEYDEGPIVFQESVRVEHDDDESSLHERIKAVEQRLYVEAIRAYARGRLKVEGRRVWVLPEG